MTDTSLLFDEYAKMHGPRAGTVLIVGDIMLDRFVYGAVDRISPEAPIPVFLVEREKEMAGGAGNVAANIASLGGRAQLIAAVGADSHAATLGRLLADAQIAATLVETPDRQTTVKTRFIGAGQQMLRVDREKNAALPAAIDDKIAATAEQAIKAGGIGAVILSDYGKGVLADATIARIIAAARAGGVPVAVDPKGTDFTRYKGATVITPNRKELEAATRSTAGSDDAVIAAAEKLISTCALDHVLATRGKDGLSLVNRDAPPLHIPAEVREVFDVSGAGDTVIATFALALAARVAPRNAAFIANIAAGIAVGKAGTATVRPDEMEAALRDRHAVVKSSASDGSHKVVPLTAAAEQAERWRLRGFRVGFTNGCFDLLHPGHLSTLKQAKAACDYLIVGVNADASVKRLKGPTRPVQDETARAAVLAALEMVDQVVIFADDTPIELIRAIKPDVLVKGGQYKLEEVVGYDVVMSYGGKIVRAEMVDGQSTTNTVGKMAAVKAGS